MTIFTIFVNVTSIRTFHQWLGNEALFAPVWDAWDFGERREAVNYVSDALVDALIVHGPVAQCRERIAAYLDAGVTEIALMVQPGARDPMGTLRALAPR